jgi:calcineurin-like phosphoesterase
VETSDECILPGGTGYITDLGMTGTFMSCLGVNPECVIERLRSGEKNRFEHIDGACVLGGCIFDIDNNGVTTSVERILIKE